MAHLLCVHVVGDWVCVQVVHSGCVVYAGGVWGCVTCAGSGPGAFCVGKWCMEDVVSWRCAVDVL